MTTPDTESNPAKPDTKPDTKSQTKPKKIKFPVNRPNTKFNMKANLVQNEPASVKRWAKMDLYAQLREKPSPKGSFWFHDGPPYANGSIHLGHLLNKVMKDFVVRGKTMLGYDVPYVPGWDCHGLPIEHKVATDLGQAVREMEPIQIRRKCKTYAEKQIKLQKGQMQRLLTVADYDDPYLTMNPRYEGATLEVFAEMVERGLVYRGLKPVHWSVENRTALADAELEYYDRDDQSIYVQMAAVDDTGTPLTGTTGAPLSLMIWTTTPWTIPANLAVAVHPRFVYGEYPLSGTDANGKESGSVILAVELAPKVLAREGYEVAEPVKTWTGEELVGMSYRHPFIQGDDDDGRTRRVVAAEYVTLEDGTGLVHTAPGHGTEDYQTGLREGLDVYCPVRADGTYDDTVPAFLRGQSIWDANQMVCDKLVETGAMFHQHSFNHSYPHDWRGKSPVIFRATEQWFVDVSRGFGASGQVAEWSSGQVSEHEVRSDDPGMSLKERALAVTAEGVKFIPAWGKNRMRGMLETRPDWCLSRQRAWGLPIPAFYSPDESQTEPLLTAASVLAISKTFREHGSDSWFLREPAELLAHYDVSADPDAPAWAKAALTDEAGLNTLKKSTDIFDVWFESGSSWHSVMRQRFGMEAHPVDLYLEGSDQHRGWFQLSLLPSLGVTGQAPFKQVLTHGFMVDKDGKKLSKSSGDTVEGLFEKYGADVLRWWVATLNTDNDMKVDDKFFELAGEQYRKIRNTIRFLLSNLGDFDAAAAPALSSIDPASVDAWALGATDAMVAEVGEAYDTLNFRRVSERLFDFCNDTMSAVYLTATKDRLYCDAPDSPRRRQTQSAMRAIAEVLIKLINPILPHTADEAWTALTGAAKDNPACVQLLEAPQSSGVTPHAAWSEVMNQRDRWLKAIEEKRQADGIENPLDVGLVAPPFAGAEAIAIVDLADLLGISRFEIGSDGTLTVTDLRDQPRCDRCWKRDGTVGPFTFEEQAVQLAVRDAQALGLR